MVTRPCSRANSTIRRDSAGNVASKHQLFAVDLAVEACHLFGQRPHEEHEPGLPVRRSGVDSALGLPQGKVVGLLAVLDHAFERAVRHLGISRLQ